ncbi:MAG: isopentenyl phosphate kinase [bacterium]|nr:isopentenyl phosphate kinase [bacterium]
MNKGLIIIKIGGSIVSYKDSASPKAKTTVIKRLSREVRLILEKKKYHLIVVHGVGSFGHPSAKKHNLVNGMFTDEQKLGYCLTENDELNLHNQIISSLLKFNVPAIGLPPRSFIKTNAKNFSGFNLSIIKGFLNQGLVPVLFGDIVFDYKQGCASVSGDLILPYLARKLHAKQAIFLSDVDGVFDSNPKQNSHAKLISNINDENLEQVMKGLTSSNKYDVSGEMRGKVLKIKSQSVGIPIYIINGLKPKALQKVIDGKVRGTQLIFR